MKHIELFLSFYVRIDLPLFSTVVASIICMFLSCRPFIVITTLSTPTRPDDNVVIITKRQETEVTSTSSKPVDNVVITTKGLQQLFDGKTVENKGKLILTEIFPSVQK